MNHSFSGVSFSAPLLSLTALREGAAARQAHTNAASANALAVAILLCANCFYCCCLPACRPADGLLLCCCFCFFYYLYCCSIDNAHRQVLSCLGVDEEGRQPAGCEQLCARRSAGAEAPGACAARREEMCMRAARELMYR